MGIFLILTNFRFFCGNEKILLEDLKSYKKIRPKKEVYLLPLDFYSIFEMLLDFELIIIEYNICFSIYPSMIVNPIVSEAF
nr:MAG TPA: hypothetical protein [Caudoviricetes sp.]